MMCLQHQSSARKDLKIYAFLLVGLLFFWVGATVNPSENCDESGRECAPWLIHAAFYLGILTTGTCLYLLYKNRTWGSRIDKQNNYLIWWDTGYSENEQRINLLEVKTIKLKTYEEMPSIVEIYNSAEQLQATLKHEIFPESPEIWLKALAEHYPHIILKLENL